MTQNAFLRKVREYAALAQRFRTSYAPAVAAVVEARLQSIESGGGTPEALASARQDALDAVRREYGAVDAEWDAR